MKTMTAIEALLDEVALTVATIKDLGCRMGARDQVLNARLALRRGRIGDAANHVQTIIDLAKESEKKSLAA